MHSYQSILTQEDMDRLLDSISGFHDSMTKEIHLTNRAYVKPDHTMNMDHRYDAQVLIQSQWEPSAVELVFTGIRELHLGKPGEYSEATGSVELMGARVEERRIRMKFNSSDIVVAEGLIYRVRSQWLGKGIFLKSEVPSDRVVPAQVIQEKWRQCSECSDAWEEESSEEFSHCPSCGVLTQLVEGIA